MCLSYSKKMQATSLKTRESINVLTQAAINFPDDNHYKILNLRTLSSNILEHVQHSYFGERQE